MIRGGFKSVEFTLSIPNALELIADFSKRPGLLIGAGSAVSGFVDKRLSMAIGFLGNSDGLTLQAAHGFRNLDQERTTAPQRRDRLSSSGGGCLHKPKLSPDQRGLTMAAVT